MLCRSVGSGVYSGSWIKTIYQISYDERDLPCVRQVMKELLNKAGGRICSDTDDFEPVYTLDNIDDF